MAIKKILPCYSCSKEVEVDSNFSVGADYTMCDFCNKRIHAVEAAAISVVGVGTHSNTAFDPIVILKGN